MYELKLEGGASGKARVGWENLFVTVTVAFEQLLAPHRGTHRVNATNYYLANIKII